jgi:hypothetical protein
MKEIQLVIFNFADCRDSNITAERIKYITTLFWIMALLKERKFKNDIMIYAYL